MDTEKQRQRRRDDTRLTESRNARSEQLNTRGAYRVANQQSLACLSGSERPRPGWFLDMKYQTCHMYVTLLSMCSSVVDHTPNVDISVMHKFRSEHLLVIAVVLQVATLPPSELKEAARED